MPMLRPSLVPALITACVLLSSCGDDSPPRVASPDQLSAEPARQWLGPVELVDVPAADGSRFPHLGGGTAGSPAVMSWLEPGAEGEFLLRHARWGDGAWGAPGTISAGRDWFINWADFPSVVPVTANLWIAHWLQQKPGNVYSYDVRMSTTSRRRCDVVSTGDPARRWHAYGTWVRIDRRHCRRRALRYLARWSQHRRRVAWSRQRG
jgi:hypothetical protein